jgi:hypothetical protein
MPKTNNKGRNNHTPFIKLHRGVTTSEAWQTLSCEARSLVLAIWERHNGSNNGEISFSHREARDYLRISNGKTTRAFRDAQELGFLIERTKDSFRQKTRAGQGLATEWEITTERCDGQPAKAHYRSWKKQNAVPEVGTASTYGRNRSEKNAAPDHPNGTCSRNRSTRLQDRSGS